MEDRLTYRVLTGPDDPAFCERVSAALADGYQLHGGPAITYDGDEGRRGPGPGRPADAGLRLMTYAGDLTPEQAYELVRDNPDAVLVDVRTTGGVGPGRRPRPERARQGGRVPRVAAGPRRLAQPGVRRRAGRGGAAGRAGRDDLPVGRAQRRGGPGRDGGRPRPGVQRARGFRGRDGWVAAVAGWGPACRGGSDERRERLARRTPWPSGGACSAAASRRPPRRSTSPRATSTTARPRPRRPSRATSSATSTRATATPRSRRSRSGCG